MSTAIAAADSGQGLFPALHADSRKLKVFRHNVGEEGVRETDFPRVSTPLGGSTTWSFQLNGNDVTCDELVGLLVAIGKRGELWPTDDPSGSRPVLMSHDLVTAYKVGDDLGEIDPDALEKYRVGDGTYDWLALSNGPEFGYGSGRNGSGRKAKERRVLAILRDGDVWPLLVNVSAGSFATLLPFLKRLPCMPYEAVVGLSLDRAKGKTGQSYSQVVPRLVGELTEEQGEVVYETYTRPIEAMFSARPMGSANSEE